MTRVVSIRVPVKRLAALDRRAAGHGMDRTSYLLRLVEADLSQPEAENPRRFASIHLLGKYKSKGSTNPKARAALREKREKDR